VTLSAAEAGLLRRCCLCIAENPHHVVAPPTFVLEILAACLPGRQQKHDPVPQKAQPCPVLLSEVVDVLLELLCLRVILRDERNDTLNVVPLHILQIRSMTHVQVVILVR